MTDQLINEARALLRRLDIILYDCYEEHPHLGDIPKSGVGSRIRDIKRAKDKARRRLNRRLYLAGYPIPINRAFAMWVINDVYKPGK